MSERYKIRFAQLHDNNQKAFIPFTMLGWPDKQTCLTTVKAMINCGASALELGIAFSDPLADGPTIQQAAAETIASGFTVNNAFELIAEIRKLDATIPIGLLVYYNMVLKYGADDFYRKSKQVGVDGILIVDLPPEEASSISTLAKEQSIAQIFIVSPLTTTKRLSLILKFADGFLYAVSRLGITGVNEDYDQRLQELTTSVKSATSLPILVGFGISTPEHAQKILALGADGVITGSKLIDLVRSTSNQLDVTLKEYLTSMINATKAALKV